VRPRLVAAAIVLAVLPSFVPTVLAAIMLYMYSLRNHRDLGVALGQRVGIDALGHNEARCAVGQVDVQVGLLRSSRPQINGEGESKLFHSKKKK